MSTELDPSHPEIFCHLKVVNTAYVTAALGIIRFLGHIGYLIFIFVKMCRSSADDGVLQLRRVPTTLKLRAPIEKDPTVVPRINPADQVRPEDFIHFLELDDDEDGWEEEEPVDVDDEADDEADVDKDNEDVDDKNEEEEVELDNDDEEEED